MRLWLDTGILIRTLSALLAGQTRLNQLFRGERQKLTVVELEVAWKRLITAMDMTISFLNGNCHINRFDLLPTQYVLIPLTIFFDRFGDQVSPQQIRGLQRWVYMALIWARYSAAAESAADQDITAVSDADPIQKLIQNLEDKIGRQRLVTERELRDQRKNSPYMLLAYVLARRAQAQDWFNGVVIEGYGALEYHHIFPKEVLREKYDLKTDSRTVDQVANLAFLSKRANLKIRSQAPAQYLPTVDTTRLKAQNVPTNPENWNLERFEDFVLERRTLLADGINQLLVALSDEPALWALSSQDLLETRVDAIEKQIRDLIVKRLTDARADQAWELLPKDLRKTLQKRVETHLDQNPFQGKDFDTLEKKLEFAQFSDYPKVIEENWALFEDDFGKLELLLRHHKEVTDCRNAFKHNREVSRSSLALAEAGLIWLEDCLHSALLSEEEMEENGEDEDMAEEEAA